MAMRRDFTCWLVAAVTLLMVAAYVIAPYSVDDWGYMLTFRTASGLVDDAASNFVKFIPFHWLNVNGRGANFLAAYTMGFLPEWLVSAVCGLAVGAMCALVLRLGGAWRRTGRQALGSAAIAVILCAFPWWDWMFSVDLNFNYILSATLVLAFVWMLPHRGISDWVVCPLALVAGCMHEAAGLPVLAAILFMLFLHRHGKPLHGFIKRRIIFFACGVAVVFFSPGIWGRFMQPSHQPDAPMWYIVVTSATITLLMLLVFALACCRTASRRRLKQELHGPLGFFCIASLVSLPFCAVSGVLGRSGWFSQIYALIALLLWFGGSDIRIGRWLGAAASVLFGAVSLAVAWLPIPEFIDVRRAYNSLVSADNGLYFGTLTDEHAQPWYTLGRVRSVEPSDTYYLGDIARYHGLAQLIPLPSDAEPLLLSSAIITTPVPLSDGSLIAPYHPEDYTPVSQEGPGFRYIGPDGRLWVCALFTSPATNQPLCHLFPYRPFYAE